MLRDLLRGEGAAIGRQHVATMMKLMCKIASNHDPSQY
jgi:hypothetical protein